jgi:hypothetical protein
MVYFANFQHILLYVRLTFSHNQTRWATCFIRVLFRITRIARVDGVIPSTDPIFASGCKLCLATCFIREHSACRSCEARIYSIQTRRMSEVGRCPCSGLTHGCRFYSERWCMWTLSWVLAWKVRCVLWSSAGTLTSFRKSLSKHGLDLDQLL